MATSVGFGFDFGIGFGLGLGFGLGFVAPGARWLPVEIGRTILRVRRHRRRFTPLPRRRRTAVAPDTVGDVPTATSATSAIADATAIADAAAIADATADASAFGEPCKQTARYGSNQSLHRHGLRVQWGGI